MNCLNKENINLLVNELNIETVLLVNNLYHTILNFGDNLELIYKN